MISHLQKEKPDAPEVALRIFISVVIVLVSIGLFLFFTKTKPKIKKASPKRMPPRVEILRAVEETCQINISALGTVVAEKEIELKSMLSGEVVMTSTDFIPGGMFRKGDIILKIDPSDYLLEVRRMESLLSAAQAVYDIEMGYQDVAKEELHLMEITSGKKVEESSLALRKPQLDQASAQLETAKVNLAAARLNYKRTVIRAPFNGMIGAVFVNKGSLVSPQSALASFTGTDVYWVEATVPVDDTGWVVFPGPDNEQGSQVIVTARYDDGTPDKRHRGEVIKLIGNLTEKSRMARILIRISDPLALSESKGKRPLILGSYVSLQIEGKTAGNIIRLPRKALRENESIWVMEEERLRIRAIETVWTDEAFVYVKRGIQPGDSIIISGLSSPIDGMKLTEQGAAPPPVKSDKTGEKE